MSVIRISVDTHNKLTTIKAPGQSDDGAVAMLLDFWQTKLSVFSGQYAVLVRQ